MAPVPHVRPADRLELPGGRVRVGSPDAARAYDNERPPHEIELQPYWLDRTPVTAGEFPPFVPDGGYREARHRTPGGLLWRKRHHMRAPLGLSEQQRHPPVTRLSLDEA